MSSVRMAGGVYDAEASLFADQELTRFNPSRSRGSSLSQLEKRLVGYDQPDADDR